jgi:radical SAM protein with 4Fe4S-binding SPASM domain
VVIREMDEKKRFLTVFLDLHDSCNLGCKMCHFGFKKDKPKIPHFISINNFRKIAGEIFPLTLDLCLSPCTEPLFYNRFIEILEIIKEYTIPNPWISTNANLLTREVAEKIIEANIKRLLISMDSHIKEIYESIKIGGSFDKLTQNIKMLGYLKKERASKYPEINFNCLLMRSNIEYIEPYLEFIKDIGGTKVAFFHVIIFKDAVQMKGESLFHYKELCNKYLDKIIKKADKIGLEIERIPNKFDLNESKENNFKRDFTGEKNRIPKCRYPWSYLVIDCYGNIRPCEFWFGQESFGNLIEDSLNNIWNNSRYRQLREELLTGRLTRSCCINCVSMSSLNGRVDDESAFLEVEG